MNDLKLDVRTYLESGEDYPSNDLVERFLLQVKEEAKKFSLKDIGQVISDVVIRELVNLILAQRRSKLRKNEIWGSVNLLSQQPFLWQWKYGKPRKFVSPQLRDVFEIIFSYLPYTHARPRHLRKKKEYPLQKIRELKKEGLSVRKIARKLGLSKSTVHRLLQKI